LPTTQYSSPASFTMDQNFFHFWLTERQDVTAPLVQTGVPYSLPMPQGALNYPNTSVSSARVLQGDRRLITLFARSGLILTHTIENFDGNNTLLPFLEAENGSPEEH